MFTGINLEQSLHVCKRVLVWYPLAYLHGLKQKYFQHCKVTNCPAPRIENVPNRDTTVWYRTEPWILWTVTPLVAAQTNGALACQKGRSRCVYKSARSAISSDHSPSATRIISSLTLEEAKKKLQLCSTPPSSEDSLRPSGVWRASREWIS